MTKSQSSIKLGTILIVAALVLVAAYVWSCPRGNNEGQQSYNTNVQELMKIELPQNTLEQYLNYEGMNVSFNPQAHIPNYVVWELTGEETNGTEPRTNKFKADPDVPASAESWDYNYSGYDRGHMAPAGDMKWSRKAMNETFYMTNICPQAKALNTGAWKRLEEKCRQWARLDSALIIICGPVLTDVITEHIGDTQVAVPERFFKVILAPYANPIRGIGFLMPNSRVDGGLQAAAVSIDSVEAVTGMDFFAALPDDVENRVEKECDFHKWSARK